MAEHSRYNVSAIGAGIQGKVLKNKLGITNQQKLNDAETVLLADTYQHFLSYVEKDELIFSVPFLFSVHKFFLGTLYDWAGTIRKVDISKDGILFAPIAHLRISLEEFEKILNKNVPKKANSKKEISTKLAIIHNEFNAVHPFREGNGRTIRLFLDLIAIQNGYALIDWSKKSEKEYFIACAEGMSRRHDRMQKVIYAGMKKK